MTDETAELPSILDREVKNPRDEKFGHKDYADALKALIETQHQPPYSIGLLGGWGVGKSTVRELYEQDLRDDTNRDQHGKTRADKCHIVSFNAWRFGGEPLKRALLRHVYMELHGDESELLNNLDRQIQRSFTERRDWDQIKADVKALWKSMLFQSIILAIVVLALSFIATWFFRVPVGEVRGWIVAAALLTTGILARNILNPIPWRAHVTRLDLPKTTAEQYEYFLRKHLKDYKGGRVVAHGANCERLIIFVDDLDRLPADEMLAGLDAIRSLLEIPSETDTMAGKVPGIIFVISCDEGKVAAALHRRRIQQENTEVPETIANREDARRFLDRIFQFRLEIPPLPRRDLRGYASTLLEEKLHSVYRDLDSPDDVITRMIHPNIQSPRTVIHILNAFAKSWWIAKLRERHSGSREVGGLSEDAVTGHPQTLAVLCTLQVEFPDFYEDLKNRPDFLSAYEQVILSGDELDRQPEDIKILLDRYRVEANSDNGHFTRSYYRRLNTFITGIQGLRRPPNLTPLLMLSQDKVTRDLGPQGEQVREFFVSGDDQEVLRALGKVEDDTPLQNNQLILIKDIAEQVESETEIYQNNGGVVLAKLYPYLPEGETGLPTTLARWIIRSQELVSRIGVNQLHALYVNFQPREQKEVAGRLVEDLLKTDGSIDLWTQNLQSPSLDDAVEMVKEAVQIILKVRGSHGLNEAHDTQLLQWLEERHVDVENAPDPTIISFECFEQWMDGHQDHLLEGMRERYTEIVLSELEDASLPDYRVNEVMDRVESVFDSLTEPGIENGRLLWGQLARFTSIRSGDVVVRTLRYAASHTGSADGEQMSKFIVRLDRRVREISEAPGDWNVNLDNIASLLVTCIEEKVGELNSDARNVAVRLANDWAISDSE